MKTLVIAVLTLTSASVAHAETFAQARELFSKASPLTLAMNPGSVFKGRKFGCTRYQNPERNWIQKNGAQTSQSGMEITVYRDVLVDYGSNILYVANTRGELFGIASKGDGISTSVGLSISRFVRIDPDKKILIEILGGSFDPKSISSEGGYNAGYYVICK